MRSKKGKKSYWMSIIRKHSGFTLIELMVAMILLGILILIAISLYMNYLDKAKITVAEHTLAQARDNLNLYNMDNGAYPVSINFTDCVDENGRTVFTQAFCNQLREDLSSVESYSYDIESKKFIFKAKAKDKQKTLITVTPDKVTK